MAKKVKNPNYNGNNSTGGKKKISWANIKKYLYSAAVAFIVIYLLLERFSGGTDTAQDQSDTQSAQTTSFLQSVTETITGNITTPAPGIEISYELAGSSQAKLTDEGGNSADRSNWLVSVENYKDVLPQGFSYSDVPEYYGAKYAVINGNIPFFTQSEYALALQGAFEYYGPLDSLGRCTVAFDCLGRETMPASGTKRGDISSIHPSGWKQARYDCVDSETVMTRAHLAAYILSSENANERNLVSGTRYMNSDTMLEFEDDARYYIYDHNNKHVLYRVTPVFNGNELMPRGLLMEAASVEDLGIGLSYCVYIYNVQPGLTFNYSNGKSQYTGIFFDTDSDTVITDDIDLASYGLDTSTNTIHSPFCSVFAEVPAADRTGFSGDRTMQTDWTKLGYKLCSTCMK